MNNLTIKNKDALSTKNVNTGRIGKMNSIKAQIQPL